MDAIHQADDPSKLNFPDYDLHELKGDRSGRWAVKENKNWRLTFSFKGGTAVDRQDRERNEPFGRTRASFGAFET